MAPKKPSSFAVTGHGSQIAATHFRSLERFDFDSVLLPYSYIMMQNSYYADAFERLATVCQERNVAMLTIKSSLGVNPAANSRNHRVRGKAPPLPSRALAQRLLALP
jgi:hypothetical protein